MSKIMKKRLSLKISKEKPWAILKISRKQYMTSKPWRNSGVSRQEFEEILSQVSPEAINSLWDDAQADILLESMGLQP